MTDRIRPQHARYMKKLADACDRFFVVHDFKPGPAARTFCLMFVRCAKICTDRRGAERLFAQYWEEMDRADRTETLSAEVESGS